MHIKRKILLLCSIALCCFAQAQVLEPVHWTISTNNLQGDSLFQVVFHANIDKGWHLYATDIPQGGPVATNIEVRLHDAENESNDKIIVPKEIRVKGNKKEFWDEVFEMNLAYYEQEVDFILTLPNPHVNLTAAVEYMACNDESCIPPATEEFEITMPSASLNSASSSQNSLWWIFLMGLLGGLLAIFTPCVWPIIPMTVSFFMKRNESGKALKDAIIYAVSIVVIYVGLGLIVTIIFGASALNDISTNAIVNLFFFALLVLFALSFFGAFEITLPASWSTHINSRARSTSGIMSILLMAFTLVIVSFSCTGPIIGTLLVEAAGKSLLAPAIGMLGFALALALPFSLFAMFPDWMKKLPKSGGWMDSFKIVLAFLELALSLKFFSVADLAYGWHLLDREVFLSLWIIIFMLLGLYLLGIFHFRHEEKPQGISVFRFFLAICSLAFSVYMLPGLFGAPLKAISAFAPPIYTQDWVLTDSEQKRVENIVAYDYDDALLKAQNEGKKVLLDFSGYGCVNCRKMEAKVLSDSRVQAKLQDFVIVTLMVDDKHKLEKPIVVTENGKQKTLKTIGDKWSYVQRKEYGANAQPFYVKLTSDGKQIGKAYSYNEDIQEFLDWLDKE